MSQLTYSSSSPPTNPISQSGMRLWCSLSDPASLACGHLCLFFLLLILFFLYFANCCSFCPGLDLTLALEMFRASLKNASRAEWEQSRGVRRSTRQTHVGCLSTGENGKKDHFKFTLLQVLRMYSCCKSQMGTYY